MRYFIVGRYVYWGSEVALWQILNTGAPVLEITAEKFAENKAAYDEFWKDVAAEDYQDDPYGYDYQFENEGLLHPLEALPDHDTEVSQRCWEYGPRGLCQVSYCRAA